MNAARIRALAERARVLDERIAVVTRYRDRMIAKRDHQHDQIPLRPHEEDSWNDRIETAQATLDALVAEREDLYRA